MADDVVNYLARKGVYRSKNIGLVKFFMDWNLSSDGCLTIDYGPWIIYLSSIEL